MTRGGPGSTSALPAPGPDAEAHGRRVGAALHARLEAAGDWLPFADYMRCALYEPGLGYYSAGAAKFGPAGDFVTAPEISGLFAEVFAGQFAAVLAGLGGGSVLELGPGTGRFAATALAAWPARAWPPLAPPELESACVAAAAPPVDAPPGSPAHGAATEAWCAGTSPEEQHRPRVPKHKHWDNHQKGYTWT